MNDINQTFAVKNALKLLIEESQIALKADDIIKEVRNSSRADGHRKVLKIIEILSKNQPKQAEYLLEAQKLVDKTDPYTCLLKFLNHFSSTNLFGFKKIDVLPTSTPFLSKTSGSNIGRNVSEIKERVAASVSISRPFQNTSYMSPVSTVAVLSPTSKLFPNFFTTRPQYTEEERILLEEAFPIKQMSIAGMPIASQENLLIRDLLQVFIGTRSTYITAENESQREGETFSGPRFKIAKEVHISLHVAAEEMLPLATHYACIDKFTYKANFSHCGLVLQALSEALKILLNDYRLLISQLKCESEKNNLSLHKLLFYISPTLNTMEVLASVVTEIVKNELRGALALTLLFKKISLLTGDEESHKFMIRLTQSAAVPYMQILQAWIQKGVIVDPQHEFLVEDNEIIKREELPQNYSSDYWEKRYAIRRDRVPCFLESVSDMILRTGKYLNVIRQCGKKVTLPQTMNLQFNPTNQHHLIVIQDAYRFASKNLLEVLLKETDLMGHLMSVKRYLLLHQGDFIMQFMDACEDELVKNVDQVLPMKLENLLGLTLRLSSAKNDPYKDDVHCELLTYDLVTQMSKIINNEEEYWQTSDRLDLSGLECFAFRYDVKWPTSLVLNHISISKYQMLFRQLFYCKHVERQLCKIWKENSVAKKFSPHAAELYRSAFVLRQRMMNAVQNLEYYMMVEVIEPNWHIFIQNMERVENVDEVLEFHQDFLDSCLKNCMLTDTTILNRSIFKLCNICLKFSEFIQNSQRLFLDAELERIDMSDEESEGPSQKQSETSLAPTETFSERVKRFDLEFTGILIGLIKQINDVAADNPKDRFINLVHRINFNSFYNDQIEKLCAKDSMHQNRSS